MSLAHDPPRTGARQGRAELFAIARRVSIANVARPHIGDWCKRHSRPGIGDLWACCPFHEEKTPSFHVSIYKNAFNCFGCGESGDVIDFVARIERIAAVEAATRLAQGRTSKALATAPKIDRRELAAERAQHEQASLDRAHRLARESRTPEPGGVTRTYYAGRGLSPAPMALVVAAGVLREHRDERGRYSALALSHNLRGELRGVQMTKLRADGRGKRGTDCDRLTFGPYKGSACRLFKLDSDTLAVAEGVETALAFYTLRKLPTWATFGTANLEAFEPPAGIKRLVIAADGDEPGRHAAQALFDRLKKRLRCVIAAAPDDLDWLDVLNAQCAPCR